MSRTPATKSVRGELVEPLPRRPSTELRANGGIGIRAIIKRPYQPDKHPLTVLAAIPLGLVGVAMILVPLGQPIGVMAMMGLIVLAGVAVNDAVLLLSTARQLIAGGQKRVDALVTAAGIRLRPILMTSLTTILVLLPLVIDTGEGSELRSPMALTIIGGMITSTVGSLLVLPCLYLVLDNFRPGARSQGK